MDQLTNVFSDALFSATYPNLEQLNNLGKQSLSHGIDLYMNGDYKGAIREFKRSVGLDTYSEYSTSASNYMANAYIKLGEPEKAISVYKQAIKINPLDDATHITLGNMYFTLDRYDEAQNEYKDAVRLNPSTNNNFALGQSYLRLDRLNDAETVFSNIRRQEPDSPKGDYGLGLTYSKMGRYDKAIQHFEETVRLDNEFYDGYAEMGYAYMDMGEKEKAQDIFNVLEDKDISLATTLSQYIYQNDKPSFVTPYYTGSFGGFPANTKVADLDAYLINANATKTFTIKFAFDKEMDRTSVENLANWSINRATGSGPGQAYNFGLPLPSTEVRVPTLPVNVYYDEDSWTATVMFSVTQNATADGTIDPSHLEFQFKGKDQYGNKMDTEADQYSTFSGIA